jgi:DNA-binding transcriptional regulator YiaG
MDTTRDRILERIRVHRALPPPAERVALRKAAGLTLQEVADAVGVSPGAVWFWEQGQRNPSGPHIDAYLDAIQALAEAA